MKSETGLLLIGALAVAGVGVALFVALSKKSSDKEFFMSEKARKAAVEKDLGVLGLIPQTFVDTAIGKTPVYTKETEQIPKAVSIAQLEFERQLNKLREQKLREQEAEANRQRNESLSSLA